MQFNKYIHTYIHTDDRAGLRGYVQFNKYTTYIQTYIHTYIYTHRDLPGHLLHRDMIKEGTTRGHGKGGSSKPNCVQIGLFAERPVRLLALRSEMAGAGFLRFHCELLYCFLVRSIITICKVKACVHAPACFPGFNARPVVASTQKVSCFPCFLARAMPTDLSLLSAACLMMI